MIVMNSNLLLEHLTELEDKIQHIERIMTELQIEWDGESMIELLIACQVARTGRPENNS